MWTENPPDHSPTFPLLSLLHGSYPLPHTPLILGHQNIFSVFIVKSSGYWHSDCSHLLTHLFCGTRLHGNIWPAIGSLRSDSVETVSLLSVCPFPSMLSQSLGKANHHQDSREYSLLFCWRRVRFFFSFTSRGRTTQRVKIWPADTPRFPCAIKQTGMFSYNKWLHTRIERCAMMFTLR